MNIGKTTYETISEQVPEDKKPTVKLFLGRIVGLSLLENGILAFETFSSPGADKPIYITALALSTLVSFVSLEGLMYANHLPDVNQED
jgi:hypothetical protein